MIHGYDTSALFREDTILRLQRLYAEIAALQKSIEELEQKLPPSQKQNLPPHKG